MQDSLELVGRAVSGDADALTLVLTNSYVNLRDYLARRIPIDLRATMDADDLVQETHVSVFRRIESFDAQDATAFDRWVRTIATNRLRNAIKHCRAAKRGGARRAIRRDASVGESMSTLLNIMCTTDRTPSQSAARKEAGVAVLAALQVLNPTRRKLCS